MPPWQDKIRDPDCELCPLHESADHVCLMGTGSKKSKVMIVGEAPGEREDETHQAFVGPSGRLLRRMLAEVGLPPEECYITNVAKCRPPENRTPKPAEAKICASTYLEQEIELVDPDYILAVGNAPLKALTGRSGITKHRGELVGRVFPTFHPAYVLRSPQFEPTLRADLQRFARMVHGKKSEIAPSRIRLVRTTAQLKVLIRELMKAPVIAFDFETNDRGPKVKKEFRYFRPWEPGANIVCVSFSWKEGESFVIPLWHDESPWRKNWVRVLRALKPVFERDVKLVAHNGKFDCMWAWHFGVYPQLTFDTMLAAHMLDENRLKGLKPLSQVLLGGDPYDIELVDTHAIPIKTLARYAGKDTDYTLRLYNEFKRQLKEEPRIARVFARLMMPASNALTGVELGGMYVHQDRLAAMMAKTEKQKQDAETRFRKYLPKGKKNLNLNSPQQLAQFFFGDLGLSPIKKTDGGAWSTDESVMLRLAKKHPAPAILLEYRHHKGNLEKLTSWKVRLDERSRIHTNYKLFGTVTGRLSSENPNLQQVPREGPMRTCFGAPEGWTFVEADYSQIELRVAAMLARDGTLLRIFATGGDPHLTTASEVSGLTAEEVLASDKTGETEHRKKAKAVNFGFLYRMGAKKFIEYARDNYGVEVTLAEAQRVRRRYYELYSRLLPWHDRQVRLAQHYGRVHSPIGRIRHLPTVRSSDSSVRADAERQAINSPVQSFASDLMLLSLVQLDGQLPKTRARAVGTVHDSLLFEVRNTFVPQAVALIRQVMEVETIRLVKKYFGCDITVPIEVEIKTSQFWGARDATVV